ncbi:MAG: hypothetical protein E7637_03565 [Ruminococcaceae bacterium]|nr:hypothetical protein [Oscillospiraceae bacterium]
MINNIIPTPKKISIQNGVIEVPFSVSVEHAAWSEYTQTLSLAFEKLFLHPLEAGDGIRLCYDPSISPKGYRLDSTAGIALFASDAEGLLYAMASLLLAINQKNGALTLERAIIEDYPDKDYRALMVDLAREWHPAHCIHKYVDLCFLLKIKYLHLHFIDDQRYTLPSKAFPHITDGNRFYSFEDIEAFRMHANRCGITLIPEFEVPGHAASLNKNYPEVFANRIDSNDNSIVTEEGAVISAQNIICAGSDTAFSAIQTLLAEICEMFPETPYIHIGGDEACIRVWNDCPVCRAYMASNGLEDEYELYSEFVGRVARVVLDLGKTPIVWEGFPQKGVKHIPKETIVTAWESHYHMADDLLREGFKIINGSWQPLYIVPGLKRRWGVSEILSWNVYNWQHWWEHSKARLNPIYVQPTENVLGAQLSVWECTFEQEFGRTLENLCALSERVWTVERLHDDLTFFERCSKPTLLRIARFVQDV